MPARALVLLLATLVAPIARAAPPAEADRQALIALAARLDVAWDAGRATEVAALYATDATLRMDGRAPVQGRAAVQRYFEDAFARRPAGLHHLTRVEGIDMLAADLAFVDTVAQLERETPSGERRVLASFHNQTVALRVDGTWVFRIVRAERRADAPASPR